MNRTKTYVTAGLLLCCLPLASAFADDVTYCKALADKTKLLNGGNAVPPPEVPVAISKCPDAASIATLEKYLKDNKIGLPSRM